MNTQAHKPLHLPLLAGGIAVILVSGIAIGSMALSAQGFNGVAAPAEPTEAAAAPTVAPTIAPPIAPTDARAYRCSECGVIVSTRAVEAPVEKTGANAPGRNAVGAGTGRKPVRNYEITIRLRDGSLRVITDANSARWRHGERVKVIAGAD